MASINELPMPVWHSIPNASRKTSAESPLSHSKGLSCQLRTAVLDMKRLVRIGAIAVTLLAGGTAFGDVRNLASDDLQGHRSSLRATMTLADGDVRTVTLEGVGCTVAMCSRVRLLDTNAGTVWLDELASLHGISSKADGVTAVFIFRNGSERRATIRAGNRVLYVARHFGRTEQLDLAGVTRIEFE